MWKVQWRDSTSVDWIKWLDQNSHTLATTTKAIRVIE